MHDYFFIFQFVKQCDIEVLARFVFVCQIVPDFLLWNY